MLVSCGNELGLYKPICIARGEAPGIELPAQSWSSPAAGKIWRKLNQQLHASSNGSFRESGTRIREETTPAPCLYKVAARVVQTVSGGEMSTQNYLFILVIISKEWEAGPGGKGTWLLRKTKKDLSISGHLKELGFSFLTVSLQHRLEASAPVI